MPTNPQVGLLAIGVKEFRAYPATIYVDREQLVRSVASIVASSLTWIRDESQPESLALFLTTATPAGAESMMDRVIRARAASFS